MKKAIFLVLALVLTLGGCSKEDTNTPVEPDPIVGSWYQIKGKKVIDGEAIPLLLTACNKKDNFVIKEDGTLLYREHYRDYDDECKVDGGTEKVEWVKRENGAYTFKYIQQDDGLSSEVTLKDGILTVVFTGTYNGIKEQYIGTYSRTPDKSGDDVVQDLILGKWKLTASSYFEVGQPEPVKEVSGCETKSTMEFSNDRTGMDDDNCLGLSSFRWINNGGHMYTIRMPYEVLDVKITFEGHKMKMVQTEIEGAVEYNKVEVMIRVE